MFVARADGGVFAQTQNSSCVCWCGERVNVCLPRGDFRDVKGEKYHCLYLKSCKRLVTYNLWNTCQTHLDDLKWLWAGNNIPVTAVRFIDTIPVKILDTSCNSVFFCNYFKNVPHCRLTPKSSSLLNKPEHVFYFRFFKVGASCLRGSFSVRLMRWSANSCTCQELISFPLYVFEAISCFVKRQSFIEWKSLFE